MFIQLLHETVTTGMRFENGSLWRGQGCRLSAKKRQERCYRL